ncbi:phosphatidylinositol-specific phospholipase C/glycerophosphodiester phosphodiesterase family protein [Gimesia panareensis]|uniref:phosphatidylinositol-specific phospholipase C/glycerophosphodiester phosphodiesterase family protein n=1 Tax=Gimesia panareensis TaxID=2527978 RepID=UPI0039656F7C
MIRLLSVVLLVVVYVFTSVRAGEEKQTPLFQAHAHNDYEHPRPLHDALENGFWSVEADIYLVDGDLLVAHDRRDVKPERTLRKLYLDPLQAYFRKQSFPTKERTPPFTLLVDIKTDGAAVYPVLRQQLEDYAELLCRVEDGKLIPGAVQIVISGDRPKELIAAANPRYMGIDGRLSDLDSKQPADLMPLISDRWTSHFKYRGTGSMSEAERTKLQMIVKQAHTAGRRVRFWATPESEAVWRELVAADVDHINTDQLKRLSVFLRGQADSLTD